MRPKIWFTFSLLSLLACGGSQDTDIQPGDDLSGDYRGCVNDSCTEFTPAGLRFFSDGRVLVLRGEQPSDWPSECDSWSADAKPCSYNDWGRCPSDSKVFEGGRWQWSDAGELVIAGAIGLPDLTLATEGSRVEVPLHESEPGLLFRFPASYPDADWMKRVSGAVDGCLEPR